MDKLASSLLQLAEDLKIPALAVVIVAIVIAGLMFIVGTRGSKEIGKGILVGVGIGAALVFSAVTLASWYVGNVTF